MRKFFGMGLSDADKNRLDTQMSRLNGYIAENGVQVVKNDFENPFKKRDFENENKLRRDIISKLSKDSKDPGQLQQLLKAQEELLSKEYFLKVDKDGFVSIGGTRWLDFDKAHISEIIGLRVTALKEYQNQLNQFMDNFFFSRDATTTVNPEEDETNTLLKTFLRAAQKRTRARKDKEEEAYRSSQNEQRPGESDWNYARRIARMKEERKYQELVHPENCSRNFPLYLRTPVDAIIGIGAEHRGKTIYKFLVDSLGSIEGGFEKQFRNQTNMSGYDIGYRQQMARYALQPPVQKGFIDALCKSGVALQILRIANTEDIGGGQSYYQTSQHDTYTLNVWRALRLCLEQLEIYILNETLPQFVPPLSAPIPPPPPPAPPRSAPPRSAPQLSIIDDSAGNNLNLNEMLPQFAPHHPSSAPIPPPPASPGSAPPLDYGGGKLKSRSKSIRKKRISHRKKKSHSHKRRAPRRTPKRRTVNQ